MKNLNVSAPINKTGYGVASLNIIKRLTKFYNISYFPMGSIDVENHENYDIV